VLFTSGYTEPTTAHRGLLDPGVALISKPWRLDELARRLRSSLAEARQPHTEPPARLRILLTEDDSLVRMTTADLLAEMGHEVRQAANGTQTLELLDGVDLLIADIGLPDMDGRDLARMAQQRCAELRVIIASGQDGVRESDSPFLRLAKPYNEAALRDAIAASQKQPVGAPT
jgi:CheY-like chemotaxis protein